MHRRLYRLRVINAVKHELNIHKKLEYIAPPLSTGLNFQTSVLGHCVVKKMFAQNSQMHWIFGRKLPAGGLYRLPKRLAYGCHDTALF